MGTNRQRLHHLFTAPRAVLGGSMGEYLQEESRDVVSGAEMGMFYQQVDKLRDDTERLKARIDRLPGIERQ